MNNQDICNKLLASGMTKEGVCGMLGNMAAESGMRADNAQDLPGIDDATYVLQTDLGTNDFINDQIGFGYCQWTLASRKEKLLRFAKSTGKTIADGEMQIDFCILELQTDFPQVWETLTTSHDLLKCTQDVLNIYENPAVKNLGTRLDFAQQAWDWFFSKETVTMSEKETAEEDTVALLASFLQTEEFRIAFANWRSREGK